MELPTHVKSKPEYLFHRHLPLSTAHRALKPLNAQSVLMTRNHSPIRQPRPTVRGFLEILEEFIHGVAHADGWQLPVRVGHGSDAAELEESEEVWRRARGIQVRFRAS